MSPKKKSKKNAEIFADTKKSATFAPAIEKQTMLKKMMAGQLSWLERMIHNHEVPGSIPGSATIKIQTVRRLPLLAVFFLFIPTTNSYNSNHIQQKKITYSFHTPKASFTKLKLQHHYHKTTAQPIKTDFPIHGLSKPNPWIKKNKSMD